MSKRAVKRAIAVFSLLLFIFTSTGLNYSQACGKGDYNHRKKILVISPHEDDETLACAGVIKRGIDNGDDVRVMLVTNGDYFNLAEIRVKESIAAMARLGLGRDKIYYLSYGDWSVLSDLYSSRNDPSKVDSSMSGHTQTYGFPGIIDDYHYLLTGTHGSYSRQNVLGDIRSVIDSFRPTDIYAPSAFEMHQDHKATAYFTMEAILNIKRNADYSPVLHEYMIYKTGLPQNNIDNNSTPVPYSNADANVDHTSPYAWADRETVPVPQEMSDAQTTLRKIDVLKEHAQITADGAAGPANAIGKAFDGDAATSYISNGKDNSTVITVTFPRPKLIERIRTLIGEPAYSTIKTEVTIEAAENMGDLTHKTRSYRVLVQNLESFGYNWQEIKTGDAYNCRVWRITSHKTASGNNVSVPEIEFYNANLKASAIREYVSAGDAYTKYAMRDEIFWKREMSSLSYSAAVSASTENTGMEQQLCAKVADGIILGDGMFKVRNDAYVQDPTRTDNAHQNWANREFEWVTQGETGGAWVQLSWQKPVSADRIILYDRPDLDENIIKAKLTFSDGSAVYVGPLHKNGSPTVIDFKDKRFTWVRLTVEKAEGTATGLAEFEVYKRP